MGIDSPERRGERIRRTTHTHTRARTPVNMLSFTTQWPLSSTISQHTSIPSVISTRLPGKKERDCVCACECVHERKKKASERKRGKERERE